MMDDTSQESGPYQKDEYSDEQAHNTVLALLISPHDSPCLQHVENSTDVIQALVGGHIVMQTTDTAEAMAAAQEVGVLPDISPLHVYTTTDEETQGILFIVGENMVAVVGRAIDGRAHLHSLTPFQLEQALTLFAPTLPLKAFEEIVRSHPEGPEWIANWEPPDE
jgi:hypothetical protein